MRELLLPALAVAVVHAFLAPFPGTGDNPYLDLIAFYDPAIHTVIRAWYYASPAAAVLLAGGLLLSVWRVWLEPLRRSRRRGKLPPWPASPDDPEPSIVVGELHHPTAPRESERPSWLTVPETGLYTGVLIVGAIGSGKTSACMYPFARQILSWQADRPDRRAAGLILEVKGDFCHGVRRILEEAGRGEDYVEIGLDGAWQWNPLDNPLLDTYSLAYSVSTLINQLFGKSREPFWQQAYTNLVRWIIELHRLLPGAWVTLQDIYRCTIDAELLAKRIEEARELAEEACPTVAVISGTDLLAASDALGDRVWRPARGEGKQKCRLDPALLAQLGQAGIPFEIEEDGAGAGRELREQVDAIERWYRHDWTALDTKLRTSIVEGISVFLSLFDQPEVARVFCPPPPGPEEPICKGSDPRYGDEAAAVGGPLPGLRRRLPPLAEVIESGKVLALNMPAGANPALGRAIGVLLKNAWMQALLLRPAEAARRPGRYLRPATFICDEYQAFATVGQDDPGGDEKAFALTRQCRLIPIVATQSISSLRSVLPGNEAWRTLVQTLPDADLPLPIRRVLGTDRLRDVRERHEDRALLHLHRDDGAARVLPPLGPGRRREGDDRASKSFQRRREPVFPPRAFSLLDNCQAICLPYDGTRSLPARRVYLKPHYLPREKGYWRLREEGRL